MCKLSSSECKMQFLCDVSVALEKDIKIYGSIVALLLPFLLLSRIALCAIA